MTTDHYEPEEVLGEHLRDSDVRMRLAALAVDAVSTDQEVRDEARLFLWGSLRGFWESSRPFWMDDRKPPEGDHVYATLVNRFLIHYGMDPLFYHHGGEVVGMPFPGQRGIPTRKRGKFWLSARSEKELNARTLRTD